MMKTWTALFAMFVACATPSAFAQAAPGNVQAGAGKAAMCIGCHGIPGYQASFPQVHKVPMISGQSAAYIAAALDGYRRGDRIHPSMRAVAETLNDEDIADLSAYYAQHSGVSTQVKEYNTPAHIAGLIERGACYTCHGQGFTQPIDIYPKLAGQHADYLYVAMKSYKVEGNPHVGRINGVMAPIAQQFTNQELQQLANYISTLEGDLRTVPQGRFR